MNPTTYRTSIRTIGTMNDNTGKMMVYNAAERVSRLLGNVSTAQIMSRERTYKVASARQLVMWYLYAVCQMSYSDIGRAMDKSHATVMYGVRQAEIMINSSRAYDRRIREAAEKLRNTNGNETM